jgi:hypothetical protein
MVTIAHSLVSSHGKKCILDMNILGDPEAMQEIVSVREK